MDSDPSLSGVLGDILWSVGEFAFRLVPATIASLSGVGGETASPIPSGIGPITEPVTTANVVAYLEKVSSQQDFATFANNWGVFVAFSMVISLLLSTGIIYCVIRIRQIRHLERLKFEAAAHTVTASDTPRTLLRWRRIQEQANSESEESWRLAILEADIMLNELLDLQGYKGETMADKMKQITPANFNTIDYAWEAHKVRNMIAHGGSGYQLNSREVRRVIGLYERAFKEFKMID